MKPAVRQVYEFCKSEHEKERRYREEVEMCARQAGLLKDCHKSAERWEDLARQMAELQSKPSLRVSVGIIVEQQMQVLAPSPAESPNSRLGGSPLGGRASPETAAAGMTAESIREEGSEPTEGAAPSSSSTPIKDKGPTPLKLLLQEWGADGKNEIGRESFTRKILLLKNEGDLQIPGVDSNDGNATKDAINELFDSLLKEIGEIEGTGGRGEDTGSRLDLEKAFDEIGKVLALHRSKEKKLGVGLEKMMVKARDLQATYAADAARSAKEFEIAARERKEVMELRMKQRRTSVGPPGSLGDGAPGAGTPGSAGNPRRGRFDTSDSLG